MQAVRQARAAGVTSLLDRSEQQWRQRSTGFPAVSPGSGSVPDTPSRCRAGDRAAWAVHAAGPV